jgi:hypothetical protein
LDVATYNRMLSMDDTVREAPPTNASCGSGTTNASVTLAVAESEPTRATAVKRYEVAVAGKYFGGSTRVMPESFTSPEVDDEPTKLAAVLATAIDHVTGTCAERSTPQTV